MSSERQANANRENARLSTGPRTPAGKDVARWNALKHGLRAESALIPGEAADDYRPGEAADDCQEFR